MSVRPALAALCVVLVASTAEAQSTVADGVAALARGDVSRAADILRSIAEDWHQNDPAAAFFLGTLYETGDGVPADPVRACALYSIATMDGMFGEIAGRLAKKLLFSHDHAWQDLCAVTMQVGLDHRFEPATFLLAPNHTVEWTLTGATITYGTEVRAHPIRNAPRGALFLPLSQTDVPAAAVGSPPQHFIQLAFWEPSGKGWTLHWFLYEVAGVELNQVASEGALLRSASPERPDQGAVDPRTLVDFHRNDQGLPAVTIRAADGPRTVLIETLTEKRAGQARDAARAAADGRVDWKKDQDPTRPPRMQYADAEGCQMGFAYAWTADRAEALALRRNSPEPLASDSRAASGTFEIAPASRFGVEVHVYQRAVRDPFCTDVMFEKPVETVWRAVSGTVTLEVSPPGIVARQPDARRATIRIAGAVFVSDAGARLQAPTIVFSALVRGGF